MKIWECAEIDVKSPEIPYKCNANNLTCILCFNVIVSNGNYVDELFIDFNTQSDSEALSFECYINMIYYTIIAVYWGQNDDFTHPKVQYCTSRLAKSLYWLNPPPINNCFMIWFGDKLILTFQIEC